MPKDKGIVVALKAIIFNQGKILILRRSATDTTGANEWETVGGKIEFGEVLEMALAREVKEETGLDINVEKLMYATTFLTSPDRQIVLLSYLCRTNDIEVTLSSEHSDFLWASKLELIQYLPKTILKDFKEYNVLSMMGLE